MKTKLRCVLVVALGIGLLGALMPVEADAGPLYRTTRFSRMTHKFWRGVVNIPFSLAEVPIEINREVQNYDPFGGFCKGLVQGLYYTGHRLVWAVHDVVTFPVDNLGNNYGTKMRSEFPFLDETAE